MYRCIYVKHPLFLEDFNETLIIWKDVVRFVKSRRIAWLRRDADGWRENT
jgi:hypothetical protein